MNTQVKHTTLSTDVLIAGGGVGGLTAAISIKEHAPDVEVLIVEKQTTGYGGKANKGGGVLQYFDLNKIKPEDFVKYHVNVIGAFLGDQELMAKYVAMNNHMLDKLTEWGARLPKNPDGSYSVIPTGPLTAMIGVDLDITIKLRRTAEKLGVKIIDKVAISDLLTKDGKIAGATGFSLLDGTFYEIAAKSVVMATGSQNYRIGSMWGSGRGDGIAAVYRAGAELRNVEFGNFAQLVRVKSHNEVVFGENNMYNAKGEHITKNFLKQREPDISSLAIREWYFAMTNGTGPVHLKFDAPGGEEGAPLSKVWDRPYGQEFWRLNHERAKDVDTDLEVCPMLIGEQSPIKVGHDMQSTIPGLYAIGDASYCGSAAPGAVPAPPGRNRGSGILNAVFAGISCAESAANHAKSAPQPETDKAQVEKSMKRIYAPLERESGCTAKDVIRKVQSAVGPMEYSVYMHADRIDKALNIVLEAKELVPTMKAVDYHDLLSCREAEAMVLSAELHYRASAMRKESRGWFLREDYPEMDNKNWLKWIIAKNVDGEMTFTTEDVPYQKWAVQPVI
jgi:succinate dehydrogenase/fumarate reductase flavoprotein subunit